MIGVKAILYWNGISVLLCASYIKSFYFCTSHPSLFCQPTLSPGELGGTNGFPNFISNKEVLEMFASGGRRDCMIERMLLVAPYVMVETGAWR